LQGKKRIVSSRWITKVPHIKTNNLITGKLPMTIYTTLFNQQIGATNEPINASFEYGKDFTSDGSNDMKVTLSLNGAANSGTEDMIGVAFHVGGNNVSGLQIVNIDRSEQSNTQTLSTFNPTVVIGANQVSSGGPLDPGFNTVGDGSAEPYDVGIKFSEQGSGEGIVQTASFVISKPGANLDKSPIENTKWWVRLQSTDGGGGSAKTGGSIGTIPDGETPPTPNPSIFIDKVTNGADGVNILLGQPITWTYKVSNTGNVPLSGVSLTDDKEGSITNRISGDTDSDSLLDTNEVWTYTKTGTAKAGSYSNTGDVTGSYNGTSVTDSDPSSYFGAAPAFTIEKLTNGYDGKDILTGQQITWTYKVTNTGNIDLTNLEVKDDNGTPLNTSDDFVVGTIASLAVGSNQTLQKTSTAITGAYANIGTASNTYTDGLGNSKDLSATDPSNYFGAKPALTINKLTNGYDGKEILAGKAITWTYEVKNTGNVNLTNVEVKDDNGTPANTSDDFVVGTIASLATGQSTTLQKTSTAVAGTYTNIGKASNTYTDGVGNSTNVSATDPSNYFGANPKIAIDKVTKSTPAQGDGLLIPKDSAISWIYTVTNTGNVPLSDVKVTDDKGVVPVYQSGDTNLDGKLGLTESWVYSANGTAILGSYQNIGTAKGSYTDGLNNAASPTASDPSSYTGVRPPGARTPGFWQAQTAVWDGVASNDSSFANKSDFPASDLLLPPYSAATVDPITGQTTLGLLIGDYNRNGKTDAGENTVFYTLQEARTIVSADQKVQQDVRYTLDRSLVASWLNYLAVNPAPTGDMNQAISWLQKYTPDENSDGKGDGNLSLQASTYKIAASSPAWANANNTYNGLPTGEVLHKKLDDYNNTGLFGTQPV
jgi:hypothetical protein